jgi:hypothetical protein
MGTSASTCIDKLKAKHSESAVVDATPEVEVEKGGGVATAPLAALRDDATGVPAEEDIDLPHTKSKSKAHVEQVPPRSLIENHVVLRQRGRASSPRPVCVCVLRSTATARAAPTMSPYLPRRP